MKYDKQKIPTISSDKISTCYICNIIYYIKKCRFLSSNVTFLLNVQCGKYSQQEEGNYLLLKS